MRKGIAVLLSLCIMVCFLPTVPAYAVDAHSNIVDSIVGVYESRLTWEDSVPKLDWKANEATMGLLKIIAHDLDRDGSNWDRIEAADDSYESRLTWEDSVPKLDWKANEASMKILEIIAQELDVNGYYTENIQNFRDTYDSRASWEESVPKLNWKANEASSGMMIIIAYLLDDYDLYSEEIKTIMDPYTSRLEWEDSVPKLNWKLNECRLKLMMLISLLLDKDSNYSDQIFAADDSYLSRLEWETSVPKLNWKADEAIMNLAKYGALVSDSYFEEPEEDPDSGTDYDDPADDEEEDSEKVIDIKDAEITAIKDQTYSGKKLEPSIDVELNGEPLIEDFDYKVVYKNNKNVGVATVTLEGIGDYTGTLKTKFKILPKKATLKTVKGLKKSIKVTWGKVSTKMSKKRITGYQIQLATNSKFTKNKRSINVKGYAKTSKTIKSLKKGKKYYVRIRTYMKIGGKTYYSKWSKVKNTKTK